MFLFSNGKLQVFYWKMGDFPIENVTLSIGKRYIFYWIWYLHFIISIRKTSVYFNKRWMFLCFYDFIT